MRQLFHYGFASIPKLSVLAALGTEGEKAMTQKELNEIWKNIQSGKYGVAPYRPEKIAAEDGKDIMSIPNSDGTKRSVYERSGGGPWNEVPDAGGKSEFEKLSP